MSTVTVSLTAGGVAVSAGGVVYLLAPACAAIASAPAYAPGCGARTGVIGPGACLLTWRVPAGRKRLLYGVVPANVAAPVVLAYFTGACPALPVLIAMRAAVAAGNYAAALYAAKALGAVVAPVAVPATLTRYAAGLAGLALAAPHRVTPTAYAVAAGAVATIPAALLRSSLPPLF